MAHLQGAPSKCQHGSAGGLVSVWSNNNNNIFYSTRVVGNVVLLHGCAQYGILYVAVGK